MAECSIEEKGFIVVFVTKPAKAAVEPSTVPAVTPAAPAASTPVPAPAAAAAAIPATTVAATAEPAGAAFGSLLTGSALETAISNICEMGFAREEVCWFPMKIHTGNAFDSIYSQNIPESV